MGMHKVHPTVPSLRAKLFLSDIWTYRFTGWLQLGLGSDISDVYLRKLIMYAEALKMEVHKYSKLQILINSSNFPAKIPAIAGIFMLHEARFRA